MEGNGVMGDEKPHSNPRPSHSLLGRLLVPKCNGPGQHCALRALAGARTYPGCS
jgi:hypothetical protein